jgi:predicted RNA-binding protein with PIN domain
MRSRRRLESMRRPCDPGRFMRSLWLVDGYNVLRVSLAPKQDPAQNSSGWWSAERRSLLVSLAGRLRGPTSEVCLVFDGRHLRDSEEAEPGDAGVRVVFAPSADDWIVDTVKRRSEELDEIRVVTADRALANRVRSRGAEVVATDRFLASCHAVEGDEDEDEIDETAEASGAGADRD